MTTTSGRGSAFGVAKQTAIANGTSFTASNIIAANAANMYYQRWNDGAEHDIKATYQHQWEGDGSRGESLAYKQFQYGQLMLPTNPRPEELALAFQAFTGKNSNAVTGASAPYTQVIHAPATDVGNDYFTVSSFNTLDTSATGGKAKILQTADALCHKLVLAGSAGKVITLEETWSGGVNQIDNAGTHQPSPVPINSGLPYYFQNIVWTMTNMSSAFQGAVKDFSFTFETTLTPTDFQAEGVFPLTFVVGNLTITGTMTVLWQDWQAFCLAYFGGASTYGPDVTTSSATVTGSGNVQLALGNNTPSAGAATLEFPNMSYEGVTQKPALNGAPVTQQLTLHAIKGTTTTVAAGTTNVPYALQVLTPSTPGATGY